MQCFGDVWNFKLYSFRYENNKISRETWKNLYASIDLLSSELQFHHSIYHFSLGDGRQLIKKIVLLFDDTIRWELMSL